MAIYAFEVEDQHVTVGTVTITISRSWLNLRRSRYGLWGRRGSPPLVALLWSYAGRLCLCALGKSPESTRRQFRF